MKNLLSLLVLLSFTLPSSATKKKLLDQQVSYENYDKWKGKPKENFSHAKANFEKTKATLLKKFYQSNLSEEELYRAATQGMLNSLNRDHQWNKLLSPTEIKEIQSDAEGRISGIGVVLKFSSETGIATVMKIIEGNTAQKAGLLPGDQIISVNGTLYKGKQFRDLIYSIRGKVGSTLKIKFLRGDRIRTKTIRRQKVTWTPITNEILSKDIGLITILHFSKKTTDTLRTTLKKFSRSKIRALIIDLRGNSGGLFDQAISSSDLFVKKGATIAKTIQRGQKKRSLLAKETPLLSSIPVLILVSPETSSGAELFAASLKENINAQIAGQKTFGKWSAQVMETLPNGFAIKYTTLVFQSPSGKSFEGVGITPDIQLADQVETSKHSGGREKKLSERDSQLKAAVELAKMMM